MVDSFLRRYNALLVVLAVVCAARLAGFAWQFSRQGVQVDFAAFYFGAAALRDGYDPYANPVVERPDLWDGVAAYRHSRFLYPPIVAAALRPVAAMDFPTAKTVWTFLSLGLIAVSVRLAIGIARVRLGWRRALLLVVVGSLVFPLIPFMERGQIDAWTLLFASAGFYLIFARGLHLTGGAVMALAAFVKLQCFFLLPLLVVGRLYRSAIGMGVAAVVLLALQVVLCGWALTGRYLFDELPRISRYGEAGPADMRLGDAVVQPWREKAGPDRVLAGGRWSYRYSLMPSEFAATANATPYVRGALAAAGARVSMSAVSVGLLAVAAASLVFLLRGTRVTGGWGQLAFAHVCLIVVLVTAPITWVFSVVWLVPLAVLMLYGPAARGPGWVAGAAWLGYLLLLLPDGLTFGFLFPRVVEGGKAGWGFDMVLGMQYLVGMLLVLPYVVQVARGRVEAPVHVTV